MKNLFQTVFAVIVTVVGINIIVTNEPEKSCNEERSYLSKYAIAGKDEASERLDQIHKCLLHSCKRSY